MRLDFRVELSMLLGWFGSVCIGLVWGWVMGHLIGGLFSQSFNGFNLWLGSILLSIQTYLFADFCSLALFWGGTISGLVTYGGWSWRLHARSESTNREGGI